jgi:hypothetical protein
MSWPAGAIAIGMFGAIALGLVCDAPARPDRRIVVGSDAAFARAERALRNTGGTIVLRPRLYRRLTISARSRRPLRILGTPGARVEDVYLYGTRNVSLGRVRIGPIAGDAVVELWKSRDVVLHDLVPPRARQELGLDPARRRPSRDRPRQRLRALRRPVARVRQLRHALRSSKL